MDFSVINVELVAKLLLLLLIGMGPKIALVPFLEKTKHLDAETQRAVGRRMVLVAVAQQAGGPLGFFGSQNQPKSGNRTHSLAAGIRIPQTRCTAISAGISPSGWFDHDGALISKDVRGH
jgi:hypothetical protein